MVVAELDVRLQMVRRFIRGSLGVLHPRRTYLFLRRTRLQHESEQYTVSSLTYSDYLTPHASGPHTPTDSIRPEKITVPRLSQSESSAHAGSR